jgi:hypothetical protein
MTKLLSISELTEVITQEYAKTSERTIRYCIEKGELRSTRFKPKGKHFINPADIPAFLLANEVPKESIIKIMQAVTNAS